MRRGGDSRGSALNRRRRKDWLLSKASGHGGNGSTVKCHWCRTRLTFQTVEADRFPIAGQDGGTYRRKNIVPACRGCNSRRTPPVSRTKKAA